MGIKHDPTTGLPSNDNSSYEELLQMWREEKQKRQNLELETIKQVEAAKKEADKLMINKVSMYEDKLKRKEEDINRVVEENNNYETISKSHKEINGKLQTRVKELEEDNKKLSKQIEDKDKHIKQLVDVM
jgi:chromosome segregation ATPase